MKFEYQAIDEDGTIVRGIIKANNPQKVLQILLHKQLHPLDIRILTESTIELNRLNNLKNKLQNQIKNLEPDLKSTSTLKKPSNKLNINWSYLIFLLLISTIMIAAVLNE